MTTKRQPDDIESSEEAWIASGSNTDTDASTGAVATFETRESDHERGTLARAVLAEAIEARYRSTPVRVE